MENRDAVLKTLLYSDIFDYPLTPSELWNFLITTKKINKNNFISSLSSDKNITYDKKSGYIFIKGRDFILEKRKIRKKISSSKLKKAKEIIKKISIIPSVKFIGISGALSMENSEDIDDIDIFVIAEKNLVWSTRFLIVLLLILTNHYRNKNDKNYSDKICLNMIIGEDKMHFDKEKQNLYTAHEICQIIPVFQRDSTFDKFMSANKWIKNIMPNVNFRKNIYSKKNRLSKALIFFAKLFLIENILRFVQFEYMKKNITKESVEKDYLAFHPVDYRNKTLSLYKKKLRKFKIQQ